MHAIKPPTGVVSLQQPERKDDIMTRPFDSLSTMFTTALEYEKTDPALAEKVDELWRKTAAKTSGKWSLQQASPRVKSPSQRHCEYTNSRGFTTLVPQEHAKALSPEQLRNRLEADYYG